MLCMTLQVLLSRTGQLGVVGRCNWHMLKLLGFKCSLPIAIFSIEFIRLTTANQKLSLLSCMFPNLHDPNRRAGANLLTIACPLPHDGMHELLKLSLMPVLVSGVYCGQQQEEWWRLGLAIDGLAE